MEPAEDLNEADCLVEGERVPMIPPWALKAGLVIAVGLMAVLVAIGPGR